MEKKDYRFKARKNGFWISFPNGYTLSTQFGPGSYADNYEERDFEKEMESSTAEVGIMRDEELIKTKFSGDDTVIGYVDFDKWLEIFDWVRCQKEGA